MEWYYAENNVQKGPVSDAELAGLVSSGSVRPETLVWHSGLSGWVPFGTVNVPAPGSNAPPPPAISLAGNQVICVECQRAFPMDQCVMIGNCHVCGDCKPAHVQKLKEGVIMQSGALPVACEFGGFWIRVLAKIIDSIALFVVIGLPSILVMLPHMKKDPAEVDASYIITQLVINLAYMLVAVAYNTFFIGKFGATPGKMALGLKVIMADGSPPTMMRAFGRAWAEQLSGMICYIGYIMVGFDVQKRGLHDHMCSTRVVKK